MRNIVLCDNQEITRFGLSKLIANFDGLRDVFQLSDKKSLVLNLEKYPDSLVCFDYTLFDFVSIDELVILESRFKSVNWILFSDDLSTDFVRTLLYSTSMFSVLLKDSSLNEISMCFIDALNSRRFICNRISNLLLENSKQSDLSQKKSKLTNTEQEILIEMALGKTTKEIAEIRFVSVHTIMTHRKNIFRKLAVNNVHEATKYAIRSGLIDIAEYYI
jgi:DNA-binding NarL/FixJ family response regulator